MVTFRNELDWRGKPAVPTGLLLLLLNLSVLLRINTSLVSSVMSSVACVCDRPMKDLPMEEYWRVTPQLILPSEYLGLV